MVCKNCKKKINDTAVFCEYCGMRVFSEDSSKEYKTHNIDEDKFDLIILKILKYFFLVLAIVLFFKSFIWIMLVGIFSLFAIPKILNLLFVVFILFGLICGLPLALFFFFRHLINKK